VPLVQISTDYVFDGSKSSDYAEDDATNPLSVYGTTKLAGELAARTLCKQCWILRTSWLFSEHGTNFVKTVLRLAASADELRVVADQRGRPTYAGDVAALIASLLRRPRPEQRLPFGTYHAVGGAVVSWHELANIVVEQAFASGVLPNRVAVRAITTAEYPAAARRPANSALRPSSALGRATKVAMDWERGLRTALQRIRA
jgi:dTDP-4-dehydrorhamnose reductase